MLYKFVILETGGSLDIRRPSVNLTKPILKKNNDNKASSIKIGLNEFNYIRETIVE